MSNTNIDSYLWIVFSTFLHVVAAAAVAITAASLSEDFEVPRDVARDMVDEFIRENNITSLSSMLGVAADLHVCFWKQQELVRCEGHRSCLLSFAGSVGSSVGG